MVIRRATLVGQRGAGETAFDHLEILAQPIELAQMPRDREALVLGQDLLGKPGSVSRPRTNPDAGRTGSGAHAESTGGCSSVVSVAARADCGVSPAGAAPGWAHRDPDLRQEAAGASCASTPASMVSVLILACAMIRTCCGLAMTTRFTWADDACHRGRIPGCLDDDHVLLGQSRCKGPKWSRRMSTRPSRLSLPSSQATASAKTRWMSNPMTLRCPLRGLLVPNGSWRATRQLLIRARSASGRVARGGHVTSSGSQPNV